MPGWFDKASFEAFRLTVRPDKDMTELPPLCCLQITDREIRATDGRAAVRIRNRSPEGGSKPAEILKPICISRETAQALARDAGNHDVIQVEDIDDQWVRLAALDKVSKGGLPIYASGEFRVVPHVEPSKPFPNIDALDVPEDEPRVTICLSAQLLTQIAAIAKAVSGPFVGLQFEIWGDDRVVRISAVPDEDSRFHALAMPMAEPER